MKLTEPQYLALKKYEDSRPHNEKALKIRLNVYETLVKKKLVKRSHWLNSIITSEGLKALETYEASK